MSQRIAKKHKHTVYCPINGCNYTSRQWVVENGPWLYEKDMKRNTTFSTKCPKHQTVLLTEDKLMSLI